VVNAETRAFLGSMMDQLLKEEREVRPVEGFVPTSTSSIGVEQESFMMEEILEGTRVHYLNVVEARSRLFRLFGFVLLRHVALWY